MALSVFKATYTEFFFVSPYVTHLNFYQLFQQSFILLLFFELSFYFSVYSDSEENSLNHNSHKKNGDTV